ncbi:hypothetical protein ACEQPO_05985 [Bacillus sp. SL00103]
MSFVALAHTGIEKTASPKGSENMIFDLATKTKASMPLSALAHKFTKRNHQRHPSRHVKKLGQLPRGHWADLTQGRSQMNLISNSTVKDAIQTTHQNTLDYVRKPVWKNRSRH